MHLGLIQQGLKRVTDIEISTLPFCGALFRGACDKNVIDLAVNALGDGKVLSYVLTLNTHLPVIHTKIPDELSSICDKDGIPVDPCMHIVALENVISNIVTKTSKLKKAPLVVIMGDHSPPFYKTSNRDVFLKEQVLGYVLKPKT